MSYDIEHGKRVLVIPENADERFNCWDHWVFAACTACNNVTPRTFTWHVVAVGAGSHWNGEAMLPGRIWEMGASADGGSIKPWDKDVTGLSYLKSWKNAVKEAKPILDGENPLWKPKVTLYTNYRELKVNEIATTPEMFKGYNKAKIHEAFMRLFPKPISHTWEEAYVATKADLLDAIYLWQNRENLPYSLYLESDEKSLKE